MRLISPCRFARCLKSLELAALIAACAAASAAALEPPQADWASRFHIGGNAAMRVQAGARDAQLDRDNGASVYQAGLVFDVDIAPLWSFWGDLILVREAQDASTFKEQLYVRRDSAFGYDWLNAKFGRIFTPYGEDYLHWNQISNPLASWTVAFPWALDEGVLAFGDILPDQRLSYVLSVQNGNRALNFDDNVNKTAAIKLSSKPWRWLYVSSSFLNLGKQGNDTTAGAAEFWLSGFHISPIGTTTAAGGASPGLTVSGHLWEQDVKVNGDWGEVWANFGYFHHIDGGGHQFDRYIRYYAIQPVINVPRTNKKAYLAARYSKIETMSATEGYRFAGTQIASSAIPPATSPYASYNYNQRDLYRWSLGGGYWLNPNVLAKAEYSFEDSHLISSAQTDANLALRGHRNFFVAELAVRF